MERAIRRLLRRYGSPLGLARGEEAWEFRGFLYPVRSEARQNVQWELTALGQVPRGQYVLIAPAGLSCQSGDIVTRGEKEYLLRRSEQIYYGQTPVYIWGVCTEKGGDDPWA